MSYITMKQIKLPPSFPEEDRFSTREWVELGLLTLITIALGGGFVWFIIEATRLALTM